MENIRKAQQARQKRERKGHGTIRAKSVHAAGRKSAGQGKKT
jgi:hypothetical protein